MIDFKALSDPFNPALVSWRLGSTNRNKDRGMALAYIDARDVMERLDEICGPAGWQCRYSHANGTTVCEIGILCGDTWVWKADGSGDTDVEAEKGALSGAFKRAAVRWGIGRYLYHLNSPWVVIEAAGNSYKIIEAEYARLMNTLPRPAGMGPPANNGGPKTEADEKVDAMKAYAKELSERIAEAPNEQTLNDIWREEAKALQELRGVSQKAYDTIVERFRKRGLKEAA